MPTETLIVDGCYGIACNRHASCQLYENVNGSKPDAVVIIGSCNIGLKDHPKFVPLRQVIGRQNG